MNVRQVVATGLVTGTLLLAGYGLIEAIEAASTSGVSSPTTYKVTLSNDQGTCTQRVTSPGLLGIPHTITSPWFTISESKNDTVLFADSGAAHVTVTFPDVILPAYPGTPFFDFVTGNWLTNFDSRNNAPTPVATLTPAETAVAPYRFPYNSVAFSDGSSCKFPRGAMGIQVTK